MKFPYSKLPSHNPNLKWIARPYIPIKILGPKRSWEGYGLIDSGADDRKDFLMLSELSLRGIMELLR